MRKYNWCVILIAIVACGCILQESDASDNKTPELSNLVYVSYVIDGDTIDVIFENGIKERVRLVGIDTPECYCENNSEKWPGIYSEQSLKQWGIAAKKYSIDRLLGKYVSLEFDSISGIRGSYGRLLAYVILNGENINLELVALGYARVYEKAPCEIKTKLLETQKDAQESRRGVWSLISDETRVNGLRIDGIIYDAKGDDITNINGEYIILTNHTNRTICLSRWEIVNGDYIPYTFPEGYGLGPYETIIIRSGKGNDTKTELYWNSDEPIWGDLRGIACLYDSYGAQKDLYQYG
ncbi:MAG: thermonuclease family protein [Candidatus Methanofastidiosia archaeon]